MIVTDPPLDYPGRFKQCSHLISDQPGEAGHAELMEFARRVGLRPQWIQHEGTPKEHFDVFGARRIRCLAEGAKQLSRDEFVTVLRRKRGHAT